MTRRYQGGAIGLSAALLLLSALLLAAFAIDTARLFFAQRQLQTQADLAALAMSRGACYLDGVNDSEALADLALANLLENGFDASTGEASFSFGEASIADNHWQLAEGASYQPAGRVSLTGTRPASLLAGGLWGGTVELGAAATVYKRMAVGFGIGSGLVDLDLTNSLLGALLGGNVNVLSYEGLATASLSLGRLLEAAEARGLLATDLEVGTVDEVLESEVALADLLAASIDALNAEGSADVEVIAAMEELRSVAQLGGLDLTLSDLLQLATPADAGMDEEMQRAALATRLDLYGLATGAIYAANQGHFVEIPGLAADLGIAGLGVGLTIIEPPQYTFGLLPAATGDPWVASVETAQIELDIKATLLDGGWIWDWSTWTSAVWVFMSMSPGPRPGCWVPEGAVLAQPKSGSISRPCRRWRTWSSAMAAIPLTLRISAIRPSPSAWMPAFDLRS
ncbi:pilus assembly protein TadG-related protein [Marinobacterium aestuariivivens]|uniref:Pilus assembly protein TadG-related protein n=1 Tax=Marinobacterium aestuariivivens TaxID=1698799 RepID=A0ABW2A1A0_9GAMM